MLARQRESPGLSIKLSQFEVAGVAVGILSDSRKQSRLGLREIGHFHPYHPQTAIFRCGDVPHQGHSLPLSFEGILKVLAIGRKLHFIVECG